MNDFLLAQILCAYAHMLRCGLSPQDMADKLEQLANKLEEV